MNQEYVNSVREAIDAFNRRDFDAALQRMTGDATWAPFLARTETQLLQGRSAIRAAWESQVEVLDLEVEFLEFVAGGDDCLVTRTRIRARGHGSDIHLDEQIAHVFTFQAGLVSRVESYEDVTEALQAAGLAE